ncbi:MAG: translation initiation factor IF-2 [Candidatus Berkelbacteria bacterium]|nr:MAG: translation initiation factor IF-2 [Candidatus Berkelbacteria bacterium]QQG52070.1 MAG: translation initiation factor IF-2 [Candidatus Berkelbacteria bacterium]
MTDTKLLHLPETVSVRTLASQLNVEPTAVIGKLIANGVMAHINQNLDYDTAALLAEEFGFTTEPEVKTAAQITKSIDTKNAEARAPIVTIMGHVDHGKTSLLDYIRSTNVAAGESGGITQNISAYQIDFTTSDKQTRKITFIDTPGHEAFSALRAHGASITDLVVLVVAADDGVKPQTIEAINHAKLAGVPIIVAINKTDVGKANIERVKQQLAEHELIPEEWGGKTVMTPLSAKTGDGVDNLLELIILTTDLLELKADASLNPEGIVLEANLDKQVGPIATVLIYNGTLHTGQVLVVGKTYGRIRSLEDDRGRKLPSAGPAQPVVITGLKDVPTFGDRIEAVPNEKVAKTMTQSGSKTGSKTAGDSNNSFRIVLKVDVGGSLAALEDSIHKLKIKDATVEILSAGIGQINENDINLAKASGAAVISFRSAPLKRVLDLAEKDGVPVKEFWIIYEVIDFLKDKLTEIATPTYVTIEVGRLKVLEVFSAKGPNAIAGGEVTEGEVSKNKDVVIFREKEEVGKGKVISVKMGKVDVDKAEKGAQCGMSLEQLSAPVEKGDVLVFSETKEE